MRHFIYSMDIARVIAVFAVFLTNLCCQFCCELYSTIYYLSRDRLTFILFFFVSIFIHYYHWPIFHYYLVIKIFDSISRQDIESTFSFDYCLKYLNVSDSICCLCLVFSTKKNFCVFSTCFFLC